MPPTARDAGFAEAVEALAAARARGEHPAALVVTTLSPRRLQELRLPSAGEPRDVLLSGQTTDSHDRFRGFSDEDWRRIANLLREGCNWTEIENRPGVRVLWIEGAKIWMAVVKQAQKGKRELFLITAHRARPRDIRKLRGSKKRGGA
ncbi:MAG: hypothetical protein OXU53_02405 [Deltaproteobacteria bacterium]|nr:hypothetical protein [Deltaproteobacteria bacterium]